MSKNTKTAALATTVPAATVVPAFLSWSYGTGAEKVEFALLLSDMFGKGIEIGKAPFYLLQNGFKQSMADSIAGYAKELSAEGEGEGEAFIPAYTPAEIHALVVEALNDRFAKIMAGDVGLGTSGPRLRGIDAIMRDVAVERLKAAFATNKALTVPKGDNWTKLVQSYIAKNDAALRDEATKRQNTAAGSDDLSGLLADLAAPAKAA